MADETTDVVDPYVKGRVQYFRKVSADGAEAVAQLKEASRTGAVPRDVYLAVALIVQEYRNLAYGLDEAIAALDFYADPATWTEVPAKTFAASDLGAKARVAKARIDPV